MHGSLLGKCLLQAALISVGSSPDLDHLQYSTSNKPFLPDGPHFNISHSANRVACVVSAEHKVGVDLEYITDINFDDFKSQLTPLEWKNIHESPAGNRAFFDLWTAKESVVKADGRGIAIDLRQVEVIGDQPIELDGKAWHLINLTTLDNYACHLAIESNMRPDGLDVRDVRVEDILSW